MSELPNYSYLCHFSSVLPVLGLVRRRKPAGLRVRVPTGTGTGRCAATRGLPVTITICSKGVGGSVLCSDCGARYKGAVRYLLFVKNLILKLPILLDTLSHTPPTHRCRYCLILSRVRHWRHGHVQFGLGASAHCDKIRCQPPIRPMRLDSTLMPRFRLQPPCQSFSPNLCLHDFPRKSQTSFWMNLARGLARSPCRLS